MRRRGSHRDAVAAATKAWQEIQRGRWNEALLYGNLAVAADPSWPHGHRMLGFAHSRLGDLDRAREAFQEAIRTSPDDASAYVDLGDFEFSARSLAEAERAYREALQRRPRDADLLRKLADVASRQEHLDEAKDFLTKALELHPNDARTVALMGQVARESGEYEKAEGFLRNAIDRDPTLSTAYYDLALSLAAQRRWGDALLPAQQALAREPHNEEFTRLHDAINWNLERAANPQDN